MCSSYEKQGRNLLSPWRHWAPSVRRLKGLGVKIDVWENPVVYASTRDWSMVFTVRYALSLKRPLSVPAHASECLWEHSPRLFLFCMHRGGCSYWDASGEFCLPSLRVLSFSAKALKKRHCRRTRVSSSKRTLANPSKFLWTLQSTD